MASRAERGQLGEVACRGDRPAMDRLSGQTVAPAGTYRSLSVGAVRTCARRDTGEFAGRYVFHPVPFS